MTTKLELEQEFFKVFGIEPTIIDACKITDEYWNNEELADKYGCFALYMREKCPYDEDCRDNCEYAFNKIKYSEITDRKLLEMICILSQSYPLNYEGWSFNTVQDLKETILEDCIKTAKKLSLSSVFANKIQQLFKEGE